MLKNQPTITVSQPNNGRKTKCKSQYAPGILGTQKISRFLSTSQLMQMLLGDGTMQNVSHMIQHFGDPGSNNQGKVNGLC
jgi:hypothetical protein